MALLISTNMYKAEEFKRILSYVEKWKGQVGVEVFPMFHRQVFASLLEESMDMLKHVPSAFTALLQGGALAPQEPRSTSTPWNWWARPSAIQKGLTALYGFSSQQLYCQG